MPDFPKDLSVILPAYNEAGCIAKNINTLTGHLTRLGLCFEIIAVNDGSSDETLDIVNALNSDAVTVISHAQNRGKGYAVQKGMMQASGRFRMFMDVDLSTSLDALKPFIEAIDNGENDLIIGNRRPKEAQQKQKQPLLRRLFGRGFTLLSCLCVGTYIEDFTCGFKAFSAEAAEIIFTRQRIYDWSYDTELIFIARKHRLRIGQIPVDWRHHGDSKVRVFQNILTSLGGLIQIHINNLRGLYK